MSSFGARRKARVISVADEDENDVDLSSSAGGVSGIQESTKPSFNSKSGRKPFRQSGLRKAFKPDNGTGPDDGTENSQEDDERDNGPVVVRPNVNRSGSLKQKTRGPKSRLSFAGGIGSDDDNSEIVTPKKVPLGQRVLENSAAKRTIGSRVLPMRQVEDDEDRRSYSKEYLDDLQTSTPSTPRELSTLHIEPGEAMDLDASELEGALVVDSPEFPSRSSAPHIMSEAEIRERKERRARLAQEENFLSVDDDDEEKDQFGRKQKEESRLVREDEELGEGFDDYVDDGGLSLGNRAAKERRKRERQQMAELITAAEGHSSDSSSDSDAERRIAYEAAQTRAGMDGLQKPRQDPAEELLQVPAKITPLPNLSDCLSRLQLTLKTMEDELKSKQTRADQLKVEKDDIIKREGEVQALLDETGKKYQTAMGTKLNDGIVQTSLYAAELATERGLESLGATPIRVPVQDGDAGDDLHGPT